MAAPSKSGLDKNNKYDRQLRLWGDHGQTALESARVCLLNVTATGTEILKNLILPGVGSFTIVDGNKVSGEDVGNNFFLSKDSLGRSLAKVATEFLAELNDDVSGDFLEESAENLLQSNPDFFTTFSIVIATNLSERTLLLLDELLWEKGVPLLVCRCYGFIGEMRLVVKEHTVIESHPDSAHDDLRLDNPFSGLRQYCDSLDLANMTKKEHSHTPWLVILYKFLQTWKEEHDGQVPQNYKEKNQLKVLIRQGTMKKEDDAHEEEENFEEAVQHLNSALVPTSIPSEVLKIFEDSACCQLNSESKPFWILAKAVKDFVQIHGSLPLRGTIPDMTADSERYIKLQNVYREQAGRDVEDVMQHVQRLLQEIGKGPNTIAEKDVRLFCKNASFLRVVRCRSLAEEYNSATANIAELGMCLEDEEGDDVIFYILLRGVDKFYEEFNRYPGWYNDQVESDIIKLKACIVKLLHDWGLPPTVKDDFVHEICRYGAAELHSVAAMMGGVAAQEVIKIITGQFVPINNSFIYNAMKQTSKTVQL
ncbi:NEDD8-activating enzyme E1 regulatory subunit-like [Haliotis cracherodii]|uniref:NEDD8-activating enzyme E1 regulatory subunit-like n=1 Tax=Haliotis cracherodii TaxID=6455 RepID=UPI0039EAB3D0